MSNLRELPKWTVESLTQQGTDWNQICNEVLKFFRDLDELQCKWLKIPVKHLDLAPIQFQNNYDLPSIFWTHLEGQGHRQFKVTMSDFLEGPQKTFEKWREALAAREEGSKKEADERARKRELEVRGSLETLRMLISRFPAQAKECLDALH